MRIVFMGTPPFAVRTLAALADAGHEVAAVYARAPAPAGRRNLQLVPSAVHEFAENAGFEVRTPVSLKGEDACEALRRLQADLIVVVAYGLLLPPTVLAAPRLGCWNVHASLLPRWRGAAPVQRAILAGDAETGISVMRMDAGLDTGPVARMVATPIGPTQTAGELAVVLASLGAEAMTSCVADLACGGIHSLRQPAVGATYARKIDKSEALVDWGQDSRVVARQINGLSPWPGAYVNADLAGRLERIKLLRAEPLRDRGAVGELLGDDFVVGCGDGSVRVLDAQRPGRSQVSGRELFSGARLSVGQSLLA